MEIKKHIVPLISILIISNVNLLYTQFDKMMLGQVVDKVSVTVYKTPQDITYMISNLLASIVMVAVPRLAYYNSNNKQVQYMELLNKSYKSFMLVVFPACVGIACLAPEIMWIYGGGKYDASIPVLIIFAIRTMESSVYTICANQVLYVKTVSYTHLKSPSGGHTLCGFGHPRSVVGTEAGRCQGIQSGRFRHGGRLEGKI